MGNTEKKRLYDLQSWMGALVDNKFPVFDRTASSLKDLTDDDIGRSIDRICASILYDPGGTIAILRKANSSKRGRMGTLVPTVENAAMMIGLDAMRELTNAYPNVTPPGHNSAEKGYMRLVSRAYHAAYQAYDWAVCLGEMTPKEIFVAAFLHDLGAMALWLYGHEYMEAIHELKWEQQVPDDEAQYVILGFSQEQLGCKLAETWGLPDMVVECLQPEESHNQRVQIVRLAHQMAHLSETGWYTDEMVDCLESISALLEHSYPETVKRVHKCSLEAARETEFFGVLPAASLLPMTSAEWPTPQGEKVEPGAVRHFCLMPQRHVYHETVKMLSSASETSTGIDDIINITLRGLHDGLGLNRAVFALLSKDRIKLVGKHLRGADSDPTFSQFAIDVDMGKKDLFTQLLKKPRSIWVSRKNNEKVMQLIPMNFRELVGLDEFFAISVFVGDKPYGVFYADRHLKDSHLDQQSYERFKKICSYATKAIEASRQ